MKVILKKIDIMAMVNYMINKAMWYKKEDLIMEHILMKNRKQYQKMIQVKVVYLVSLILEGNYLNL